MMIRISNNSEYLNACRDKGNPQSGSLDGDPIDKMFHDQQFYCDCQEFKNIRVDGNKRKDSDLCRFFLLSSMMNYVVDTAL